MHEIAEIVRVAGPLGRMLLRSHGFATMTREILDAAAQLSAGRVVFCQEGGYSEYDVPFCGLAVLAELTGTKTGVHDPYFPADRRLAYDELQDHQAQAIEAAAAAASI
jgi:acetoin utilization deacetylase AcuC-like enzyme